MNLWTEKFRPSTLDGYVFSDPNQRAQIETWITEKSIPFLNVLNHYESYRA